MRVLSSSLQSSLGASKAKAMERFSPDSSQASPQDFLTLTKPGVLLLVVYTAAIGLLLNPQALHPVLSLISIFAIALGSAGAGAFNMWYDRDIDGVMKRTQRRPIPRGVIAPDDALIFSSLLSVTSIMILYMATNWVAAALLAFSIFFYAGIYTIGLKRSTSQNIVVGGAAGAFPPVIGWLAASPTPLDSLTALEPWLLFTLIFLWTPSHFWALALYRCDDYIKAQIPMLPVTAGIAHTKVQIFIYALLLVGASFLLPLIKPVSLFYLSAAGILGSIYIYLSIILWGPTSPATSMRLFGYSIFYLFLLFTAILLDKLFV